MPRNAFAAALLLLALCAAVCGVEAGSSRCKPGFKYCKKLKKCIKVDSNVCECGPGYSLMLSEDDTIPGYPLQCIKVGSLPYGMVCDDEATIIPGKKDIEYIGDGRVFCSTKGAICHSFEEDPDYDTCSCDQDKQEKYCDKLDACIPKEAKCACPRGLKWCSKQKKCIKVHSNVCECGPGYSLMLSEDDTVKGFPLKCIKVGSLPYGMVCDDEATIIPGKKDLEYIGDGRVFCSTKGAICHSFEEDPDYDTCSCDQDKKEKYCDKLDACIPKGAKCACPRGYYYSQAKKKCVRK